MLNSDVEPDVPVLRFGRFALDLPGRTLMHGADAVPLTPKELDVLAVLVLMRGRLVSKDDLILRAWAGEPISDSAVFQTVYRLRRTLAQYDPRAEYVATIPGRGYQFVARAHAGPAPPADVEGEVFSCYSRGMFHFHKRTRRALAASIALFRRALRLDPGFVQAHVGLAHAYLCTGVALFTTPQYSYQRALRSCHAAIALDPHCADAYAILSELYAFFDADSERAQRMIRHALSLAPGSWRVRTAAFWAFLTANEIGLAMEQVRDALASDPASNHFTTLLGVVLYYARRYEEAHAHLIDAHLFSPADSMALFYDACVLGFLREYDAAEERLAQMEPADRATRVTAVRAWIAQQRGDSRAAHALVSQLASHARPDDVALAMALTAVNDLERAAFHARRARDTRQTSCYLLPLDPLFEPLSAYMRC